LRFSFTAKIIELHNPKPSKGNNEPFQSEGNPSYFIMPNKVYEKLPSPLDWILTLQISKGYANKI